MQLAFTLSPTPILPVLFAVYVAVMLVQFARGRRYNLLQYAALTVFIVYALVVVRFVLLPIYINLPLDVNVSEFFSFRAWRFGLNLVPLIAVHPGQFIMNVALFMPLGFLLPLLLVRFDSFARLARTAFLTSLGIELAQLLIYVLFATGRTTDINDLIANTLGGVVGFGLFRLAWMVAPGRAWLERARLPIG